MITKKNSILAVFGAVFLLFLVSGCGSEQTGATYKVVTEARQQVKWAGAVPEKAVFEEGSNDTKTEMIFSQEDGDIDQQGNKTVKITIRSLKYLSEVKGRVLVDFDSSRAEDSDSELAKLIGQGYTMEIALSGEVSEIINGSEVRSLIEGSSASNKAGLGLLSEVSIKERHGSVVSPQVCGKEIKPADEWKNTKTFMFGLLGSKSYERVYKVKEIDRRGGGRIALVEMNSIPTTERAEELHKERELIDLSQMFDSSASYSGQLELDMNRCEAQKYSETLDAEWITAQPAGGGDKEKDMLVLVMSAHRSFSIEKVK